MPPIKRTHDETNTDIIIVADDAVKRSRIDGGIDAGLGEARRILAEHAHLIESRKRPVQHAPVQTAPPSALPAPERQNTPSSNLRPRTAAERSSASWTLLTEEVEQDTSTRTFGMDVGAGMLVRTVCEVYNYDADGERDFGGVSESSVFVKGARVADFIVR